MKAILANTKENNAKANALKKVQNVVGKIYWVGNNKHITLDRALRSMCMNSLNSGWYNPIPVNIKGLVGIYMINEDDTLFSESRIIKQDDIYLVEHLSTEGWNKYEEYYFQYLDEQ